MADAVTDWRGLRLLVLVLAALVLTVAAFGAWCLVQVVDARTQERLMAQQNTEADLWARMLTARMEAQQRLLVSIAQGMHTSLLDKPAVLDALMQQEGSTLRLFDSLHVALPSGSITHHGLGGAVVEIDTNGVEALRRTIAEGKPNVVQIQTPEDASHLRVLLTVPMRRADGAVAGALAAVSKLPLATLIPEPLGAVPGLQYVLLDPDGVVLAHSDVTQRWKHARELWEAHWAEWQSLSKPSAASAQTVAWGARLVTRVGLPLPQWQAVILRDMSGDMLGNQGLPVQTWLMLGLGLAILTALAVWALWGWLAPWPRHAGAAVAPGTAEGLVAHRHGEPGGVVAEADTPPVAGTLAMLDNVPVAMLLEQDGRVQVATPQVGVILGYFPSEGSVLALDHLFENPQALAAVRHALVDLGGFEGLVQLRKKDGDWVWVEVLAWTPDRAPDSTVWRLRLPWRQGRSVPSWPVEAHAWRDGLTGLPNREAFMWSLQSWVTDSLQPPKALADSAVARVPTQGCVLFVDVDHLGMMNEVTSRDMGNKMLRHIGRLLHSHVQPLGDVARLGGDEFAVLLPGLSLAHAQGVAQALCDAVWRWQPSWGGERHWVSVSVGVVAVDALRHAPQEAVRGADMACYEAKRRGRCQVAVGQVSTLQAVSRPVA